MWRRLQFESCNHCSRRIALLLLKHTEDCSGAEALSKTHIDAHFQTSHQPGMAVISSTQSIILLPRIVLRVYVRQKERTSEPKSLFQTKLRVLKPCVLCSDNDAEPSWWMCGSGQQEVRLCCLWWSFSVQGFDPLESLLLFTAKQPNGLLMTSVLM